MPIPQDRIDLHNQFFLTTPIISWTVQNFTNHCVSSNIYDESCGDNSSSIKHGFICGLRKALQRSPPFDNLIISPQEQTSLWNLICMQEITKQNKRQRHTVSTVYDPEFGKDGVLRSIRQRVNLNNSGTKTWNQVLQTTWKLESYWTNNLLKYGGKRTLSWVQYNAKYTNFCLFVAMGFLATGSHNNHRFYTGALLRQRFQTLLICFFEFHGGRGGGMPDSSPTSTAGIPTPSPPRAFFHFSP